MLNAAKEGAVAHCWNRSSSNEKYNRGTDRMTFTEKLYFTDKWLRGDFIDVFPFAVFRLVNVCWHHIESMQ